MLHNFPVTLSKKELIAENTVELTFLVDDPSFSFEAGQYVSIEIPALADRAVPDRYHDFSIASSPPVFARNEAIQEISIAFRISQSIFKTALLALPIGGVVNIDGPKGVLTLPAPPHPSLRGTKQPSAPASIQHSTFDILHPTPAPLIFVAGGIGITPLLSMIRYATETSSPQQITLLYCNTSEETTAYAEELHALAQKNPHFTLVLLLGVPVEKLFAPYVQNAKKTPNTFWYIVGAPAMVRKVEQILGESGIMNTQIRIEEFSGYLPS